MIAKAKEANFFLGDKIYPFSVEYFAENIAKKILKDFWKKGG